MLPTVIVSFALLVLLAIGVVLFTPLMHIREIRVVRTDLRTDIEHVQKTLAPLFQRHLFFLPRREVTGLLQANMPEIASVDVEKRYPGSLVVRLALDPLIAELRVLDADGNPHTGSGAAGRSYLSAGGLFLEYGEAQVGTGGTLPVIDVVDWGVRPLPRTVLLPPDMLLNIRKAEQAILDQFGQPVRGRTLFLRAREFHLRTDDHALWFDTASSLEEQLERYRIFLQAIGKDVAKEYVDLRLKDRVIYR